MTAAKRWAALAAVAMLLCAVSVHAQMRRQNFIITTGAATDTTAVGMADSSDILFTGPYERLYLDIKANRPCRIALAVYQMGDTLSPSGAVSNADTTKANVWPWFGDHELTQGAGVALDSLIYREVALPTSVAFASYEYVLVFTADGTAKWGSPRGRTIPLFRHRDGTWYWGEYTRIRWRVLGGAAGVVTVKATLKGVTFGR